jgi:hypothetical protein
MKTKHRHFEGLPRHTEHIQHGYILDISNYAVTRNRRTLATAAVGVPFENLPEREASLVLGTRAIHPRAFDQGDGFYVASFNGDTGVHEVDFTSMEEVKRREIVEHPAARIENEVSKRMGVWYDPDISLGNRDKCIGATEDKRQRH